MAFYKGRAAHVRHAENNFGARPATSPEAAFFRK